MTSPTMDELIKKTRAKEVVENMRFIFSVPTIKERIAELNKAATVEVCFE